MGNAHSAGHHNRLSKPKTNTKSLSITEPPASSQHKYPDLSQRERQQLRTLITSPVATEFDTSGISPCEEPSSENLATRVQLRLSSLSRSSSVTSQSRGVRNSISKLTCFSGPDDSELREVDIDTAIQVFRDENRTASRDDLVALYQALHTFPPDSSPIPGLDEHSSGSSMTRSSSLTRRRSLIETPGLATRTSPKDGTRSFKSWKTPQLSAEEQQKWQSNRTDPSPRARFMTLHSTDQGRDSPVPRAGTPGDISHLGALKLGSLVVTNGPPSPVPSVAKLSRRKSTADLEEEYFTSPRIHAGSQSSHGRRVHSMSQSSAVPPRSLRNTIHSGPTWPMTSFEAPLSGERVESQYEHQPDPQGMEFVKRLIVVNKSRDTLASTLQSNDDGNSLNNASANTDEPPKEMQVSAKVVDDNGQNTNFKSRQVRPTTHKTDSGYSSGGSLRMRCSPDKTSAELDSDTRPSFVDEKIVVETDIGETASLYTFEQMLVRSSEPSSFEPAPVDRDRIPSTNPTTGFLSSSQNRLAKPIVPEIEITAYNRGSPDSSLLSPQTARSSTSQGTVDSGSSTQSRLQKRRPSVQELPVVQACQPIPEGTIPHVPNDVKAKFSRRLSQTPKMEYLTRTYASKDHVDAVETVRITENKTPVEPAPSSLPKEQQESRPKDERQLSRRSIGLFRSRPSAEKKQDSSPGQENAAPTIVDFGTIASSLGQSPYDIALSGSHHEQQQRVTSPTYPHQLGNALPRVRSMVCMDSKTAAELARMRSKDRVSLQPGMLQRTRSFHENGEQTVTVRIDQHAHSTQSQSRSTKPRAVSYSRPLRPQGSYSTPTIPSQRHVSEPAALLPVEERTSRSNARSNPGIRARSTGRGPVVSYLVHEYDAYAIQKEQETQYQHIQLSDPSERWKTWQGMGVPHQTGGYPVELEASQPAASWKSPPEVKASGWYHGEHEYGVGYERDDGLGGSARTRQLHSAARRKSMHYMPQSQQYHHQQPPLPQQQQQQQVWL